MRAGVLRTLCLVLIPVLVLFFMPCTAQADNSSDGAAISLGILGAIIAVLLTVGLLTDIQNFRNRADVKSEPVVNEELLAQATAPAWSPGVEGPAVELACEQGLGVRIRF